MASPQPVTLASLARQLGLSVATVSYALRDHPGTAARTKVRVREAARALHYRTNPAVAALMTQIRRGRRPAAGARIAFVWVEGARADVRTDPFYREVIGGAQARAETLGFGLEQFWLHDPETSAVRLGRILKARGITGVVFSPCEREVAVELAWDWDAFAMAVIGNAPWPVPLHRAVHHHFSSMKQCLEMARVHGLRRCVAVLDEAVNRRADRAWEAAFLAFSPEPELARRRLWIGDVSRVAEVRAFVRDAQAECAITSAPAVAPANAAKQPAPGRTWWVMLNRGIAPDRFCGVNPDYASIAASAVDLVVGQLHHNERGIPADPKLLHFIGRWQHAAGG